MSYHTFLDPFVNLQNLAILLIINYGSDLNYYRIY